MVKLVDTKDLNPCPFGSAGSNQQAPPMKMDKILIISDKNSKSLKIKKKIILLKKNILEKKLVIVIGGDDSCSKP